MKRILSILFSFLLACLTVQGGEAFRVGYCEHQIATANGEGTDAAGQVSAAILLTPGKLAGLAGNPIASVSVGLISRINVRNLRVWLRASLDGPDLATASVSRASAGWNELRLDHPYVIPAGCEGVYVGYTFDAQGTSHPVSLVGRAKEGTSFFRASPDAGWQDMQAVGNLSLEAILEGDQLPPYDPSYDSAFDPTAYRRNVLIEEFTTEGCLNCPQGAEVLRQVLEAKGERVVAVCHHAAFGTDHLTQPCDEALTWLFNDGGQTFAPAFMFNREPMFGSPIVAGQPDNVTPADEPAVFCRYVEQLLQDEAHAQVSLHVDAATAAEVRLTVTVEQDGRYAAAHPCLTLYATEDDVAALAQASPSGYLTDYRHQHVIRYMNGTWGDPVTFTDGRWSRIYTIPLAAGWQPSRLRFVAFVANHDADDRLNNRVENVASVPCPVIASPDVPADQPLTELPEGTLMTDVTWSSRACLPDNGKVRWTEVSSFVPTIVTHDRLMYIHAPITQLAGIASAWIVGEVAADGRTVTFRTPQPYLLNNDGTMLYATRVSATTARREASTDLVFACEDGDLTQTDGGLLAITDAQGNFYGYGDMDIQIRRIRDAVTRLPEGVEPQTYLLTYSRGQQTARQTAQVAIVGADVYISDPVGTGEAWMKGTLSGTTLTIPTRQYMGAGSGYMLYVNAVRQYTTTQDTPGVGQQTVTAYAVLDQPAVTFTFDAVTGSFRTDEYLALTAAPDDLGPAYAVYGLAAYEPWQQLPAIPAMPTIDSYVDLSGYASYGLTGCLVGFTVPAADVDGRFIAQESLYYQLSFDGEPQAYYGTTYLPYYGQFADNATQTFLQCSGDPHQLQTPQTPAETISIQSFYVVGEDVYASSVFTYNVADGSSLSLIGDAAPAACYSLTGARLAAPAGGLNLVRGADGRFSKVLIR